MGKNTAFPVVTKTIRRNSAVLAMATAATGFMRQMSIKAYRTIQRRRELELPDTGKTLHVARCQIFRERGSGTIPTIVIGGFVPDSTEVVEFQRPLLRSYGDIYYMNYSRTGFSTEIFSAQLGDLVEEINNRGESPVIFAVSFGCGLTVRFLRENIGASSKLRGVVMVSPVLCAQDLTRPEGDKKGGVRLVESSLRRILKAEGEKADDITRQVERARRFFQCLFEAGAENRVMTRRHLSIRRKIMEVIANTTPQGAYERVLALKDFSPPDTGDVMFDGPILTLLAEAEENMLAPTSPSLAVLRNEERRVSFFPKGTVRDVSSPDAGDAVAHASLIFHHSSYNPLIKEWYDHLREPRLGAAV